jgi:dTMP kinase
MVLPTELNNMPEGKYIVIEGHDGTGKTTQASLLQQYLETLGKNVVHLKEPGGSPVAEAIRSVILDGHLERTPMTNILLFTANRHELWHAKIKPALQAETWVVATRNYWSTLTYQGYGEGMNTSIITAITSTFTDVRYMNPDYGVILTLEGDEAKERIAQRGELEAPDTFESKDSKFQQRVSRGYHSLAADYNIETINASKSIEDVHNEIRQRITHLL